MSVTPAIAGISPPGFYVRKDFMVLVIALGNNSCEYLGDLKRGFFGISCGYFSNFTVMGEL